ncbi:MAG: HAMP domain-containing histidine kinase [Deltaproteobacteria bacterium]|nr:HAMP domain-containing histidine kinase [Deltaproteobacteria bacterium]MBW2018657.1 HAMP domain-containing histidine kinase [Deltaproteobacteria bacterium]MBW2073386.1 HAMP domain-containing histidine kinase [Deltaproteobacteria bacterium]RLB83941.1 MAG: hypothetical protein DRH17_00220 [Deltaproteobacteria bacterium]
MAETYWGESAKEGLAFFGKMSACISHDIKNYLAIINEKAGLVGDLLFVAEQGRPLDTEKVKKLVQDISQQIKRADHVVRSLNRLAHSVDKSRCVVDLNETVGLIVSISQRLAASKGVRLEMRLPTSAVQVESNPFSLMYILFLYLDKAMSAPNDGQVKVILKDMGDEGQVTISGSFEALVHSSEAVPAPIPGLQEKLGVTVKLEGNFGEAVIRVPKAFKLKDIQS